MSNDDINKCSQCQYEKTIYIDSGKHYCTHESETRYYEYELKDYPEKPNWCPLPRKF